MCWKLELVVPAQHGEQYCAALEPMFPVQRMDVGEHTGLGHIYCYADGEPENGAVDDAIRQAAATVGEKVPEYDLVLLPQIDWLANSQANFSPVLAGQIYIHDNDHRPHGGGKLKSRRPAAIEITASVAFGTGGHSTTYGCLMALDRLAQQRIPPPGPILDMGCGTGILAIAAAKLFSQPILATDIDPIAVETARDNIYRNGTAGQIVAVQGPGYAGAQVRRAGPYGLIIANIMAGPLADMASDLDRHLMPGGRAVLSGLLVDQERQVLAPHLHRKLALEARVIHDGWTTLILHKKRRGGGRHRLRGRGRTPSA